jgi:hypothetical protein
LVRAIRRLEKEEMGKGLAQDSKRSDKSWSKVLKINMNSIYSLNPHFVIMKCLKLSSSIRQLGLCSYQQRMRGMHGPGAPAGSTGEWSGQKQSVPE